MLPKACTYRKSHDRQLMDVFSDFRVWFADFKKEFNSEPVYNKKVLKIKIKFYVDESTDFHFKEMLQTGSNHTYLAVIAIDSALKKDENYYPPEFWKGCRYIEKEVIRHITEEFWLIQ